MNSIAKIILIFLSIFTITLAQDINTNRFKVELNGGIHYLFAGDNTGIIYIYGPFMDIDKKQPGYSSNINVYFFFNTNNAVFIGVEFIESKTITKSGQENAEWNVHGYPVSVGYQYKIKQIAENLYPFISANVSYYKSKGKLTRNSNSGEKLTFENTETGYGIDGSIGLIYSLSGKIDLNTELKLRHANASVFFADSYEFSGIYFSFGLGYKF